MTESTNTDQRINQIGWVVFVVLVTFTIGSSIFVSHLAFGLWAGAGIIICVWQWKEIRDDSIVAVAWFGLSPLLLPIMVGSKLGDHLRSSRDK